MPSFSMNGYIWHVIFTNPNDPKLVDRTGTFRLATTDPETLNVYISDELAGEKLETVLIHELGHCVIYSYDLLKDIHRYTKRRYWVAAEEWVCNLIATYSDMIIRIARSILYE